MSTHPDYMPNLNETDPELHAVRQSFLEFSVPADLDELRTTQEMTTRELDAIMADFKEDLEDEDELTNEA